MTASPVSPPEAAAELLRRRQARRNLLDFTRYTKPDYRVNWHHQVLCSHLDRFARGESKRLMLFLPPRMGKSELVSRRLPAYLLGRDPDARVIACSYNAGLAADMNRDVQRVIDSPPYRRLFPETRLSGKESAAEGKWQRNSEQFEVVGRRGGYLCAGIGGGITGRGFRFGVIDDPIKGRQDADSEASRRHVWDWYVGDFFTRRADDDAAILLTLTRWHPADLAGLLLRQAEDDPSLPRWEVLRFPAVCEEHDRHPEDPRSPGDALWPDLFDAAALEETRKASGPREWAAVHQQRPVLREGGLFKLADLSRVVGAAPSAAVRVWYWDKGYSALGDFTAGVLMARTAEGIYYVEDVVRGRWEPNDRNRVIKESLDGYAARTNRRPRVYVEQPPGAGAEAVGSLIRQLGGHPVQADLPRGKKEERAEPLADQCAAGNVFLVRGPWNKDFVDEATMFPNGENDDQVDAASGAFLMLSRPEYGRPVAGGARPDYAAGPARGRIQLPEGY
jgi:predicted phage terminase large subunit-like protein